MARAGGTSTAAQAVDSETAAGVPRARQRNIVLLSDGTGNSAAKLNRTNVWWLYQALDLGDDDQIALYDDGVGTSGFRPLRLLGGAFGWGLSRNVRDLYEFLCRHYRAGDHIYIFGFSRGAFTARTLAGLICKCGILDPTRPVPRFRLFPPGHERLGLNTDAGLKAGVRLAYRTYRRSYNKAPIAKLYRRVRDLILRKLPTPEEFRREHALEQDPDEPLIEFIGVWDTVDAVGLPIDELSTMVDRLIYPHRFQDQNLSERVKRACHAIAVDDERYTFHPVLWNEDRPGDSERIEQVWFAGMHSDVGGGYPDDGLAPVSLCWMIGKVRARHEHAEGLRFDEHRVREIEQRAQPLGKMHDSRRGLGVYYRYSPRHVSSLCHDPANDVTIAAPKIHHSVFKRIANNTSGYAPAGLPTSYRVVDADGGISAPDPDTYETASGRRLRAELLERARDHVFWRRVLYYAFVFVTLALLCMPYYRPPIPGAVPEGLPESLLATAFGWLPALLPGFLGSWAHYWTESWVQSPLWFGLLAVLYGGLHWHSRAVDAKIRRLSEAAWWHVKRPRGEKPELPGVGPFEWLAARWRRSGRLQQFRRFSLRWAVPAVAAVFGTYLLAGLTYRAAVHLPSVGDGVCATWLQAHPRRGPAIPGLREPSALGDAFAFDTRDPCLATGLMLYEGKRYAIQVDATSWKDGDHDAGLRGLSGFVAVANPTLVAGIPARRHMSLPWFTLVGEIGRDSGVALPLHRGHVVLVPSRTGQLYLYVNDAINGLGMDHAINLRNLDGLPISDAERASGNSSAWYADYLDNAGVATITVSSDN
jgi:uncharacterized protein (DUF2235 family)